MNIINKPQILNMKQLFGHNSILYKDNLYIVKRTIMESHNPDVEEWKKHLNCDTVLRHDGWYFFCELIPEAEIVEEQNEINEKQIEEIKEEK